MAASSRSHEIEATILVKALPQVGEKHGETVCVAALDDNRTWYRLYPVTFRQLSDDKKFTRWNRVRATCRLVAQNRDRRAESRNIDQDSLSVLGTVPRERRSALLEKALVHSTKRELEQNRSLALLAPEDVEFFHRPRSQEAIAKRLAAYERLAASPDMFGGKAVTPMTPAPFEFGYRWRDADGPHEGLCHDWEVEQTFRKWSRLNGQEKALADMMKVYGEDYPRDGMAFAMGTHSAYPKVWMIIGVVKMRPAAQPILF
jgi:hypothetical protein